MSEVARSSFCWSVGAWTVTQRELATLRAAFARPAKRALRVQRYCGDSDEMFHRRANRVLRQTMNQAKVADMDVSVLGRMYDYAGHLARALANDPSHLTGLVLNFRDAEWKAALTETVGHQGHEGRFAPWNWERQYHCFFRGKQESWKEVAKERVKWHSYRSEWVRFVLGSRAGSTGFGS